MSRQFGPRVLALVCAFLVVVSPKAASAQCTKCNALQGYHCTWGPFIDGWLSCYDIPGGCLLVGDCSETFALDLDGRVLRTRDDKRRLLSQGNGPLDNWPVATISLAANYRFDSLFALRDCKGYLIAGSSLTLGAAPSIADISEISI